MIANAARLSAALDGRYRIERELGQGGMATVYLAEDLKHDRKVAIKVLKPELAAVLGAERFVQEIKTTAALSHPHILPLFDSGTADGFLFYVMPYIQGETIREKLNRETQFGIDEAVKIATEVADALDYAHRHGVIHRDIKPENILLHDGRPMVMDFGIALAVSAAAGGRMTETGLSLGTPHYMSPEQATADKQITGRSDIYSLASVLYEMLTGEPPHTGASAQAIIMKIIAEPVKPATELRKSVPPNVSAALAKALEKVPADRFDTARAFADAMANAGFTGGTKATRGARPATKGGASWRVAAIGAGAVAAAGWLVATWALTSSTPVQATRFVIPLPEGTRFAGVRGNEVALSPDGAVMVFVAEKDGRPHLFRQRLTELDAQSIPGGENLSAPEVSPDNARIVAQTSIGGADERSIRILPLEGGRAITIGSGGISPSWTDDGAVIYDGGAAAFRWTEAGVERLTTGPDGISMGYPRPLPGNKGFLITASKQDSNIATRRVAAVGTDGVVHDLLPGTSPKYVSGHIVYATVDGVLRAARFDADRLKVTGEPFVVAYDVQVKTGGAAQFSVSENGVLLYKQGAMETRHLTWLHAGGRREAVDSGFNYRSLFHPVLSPDETRIAVMGRSVDGPLTMDSNAELWILEPRRGTRLRLVDAGPAVPVAWSRDASHLFYWRPGGDEGFWRIRSDGTGAPERIVRAVMAGIPRASITSDGTRIIYAAGDDVYVARIGQDSVGTLLIARAAQPSLSPDDKWLAFRSMSGNRAVVVVPFPDVNSRRQVVSASAANDPHWCRGGRELRFHNQDKLMSVQLDGGVAGTQSDVITAVDVPWGMGYSLTADCSRLLGIESSQGTGRLVLVQNFLAR